MLLSEYINKYYDGNKSAFSRALGIPVRTIRKWTNESEHRVERGEIIEYKRTFKMRVPDKQSFKTTV